MSDKDKPQFIRLEIFPRKRSSLSSGRGDMHTAYDILAEAGRVEFNSHHIENPSPPNTIAGLPIEQAQEGLDQFLEENKLCITGKNGEVTYKAVAIDVYVLLAAVYSYPIPKTEADEKQVDAFFSDCLAFHRGWFEDVHSAPVHVDESFLHLHVFTYTTNARKIHPGCMAKADSPNAREEAAYNMAMRQFQDDFFEQVASKYGMSRLGLQRARENSRALAHVKRQESVSIQAWADAEAEKQKKRLKEQEKLSRQSLEMIQKQLLAKHRDEEAAYLDYKSQYLAMTEDMQEKINLLTSQMEASEERFGNYQVLVVDNYQLKAEVIELKEVISSLELQIQELLSDDDDTVLQLKN